MLLAFQPRKQSHRRDGTPSPASPRPAGVRVTVGHVEGERFCWTFDTPYDDAGSPGWHAADFAGLLVAGNPPVGVDEVIGPDGTLTLVYDLSNPDAPGLAYEVFAAPAVLHFDGDKPLDVPQSGTVTP